MGTRIWLNNPYMEKENSSHNDRNPSQLVSGQTLKEARWYETYFPCRSTEDLRNGFEKLQTDVISHLKVSAFENDPQKVVKVNTHRSITSIDGDQVLTIHIRVEFESCSLIEAHYFFSAEVGIASALSAQMLYKLVSCSQGALLNRKSQAGSFKELTHGDVKFFESFENDFVFGSTSVQACVTFASANAPFDSCVHEAYRRMLRQSKNA